MKGLYLFILICFSAIAYWATTLYLEPQKEYPNSYKKVPEFNLAKVNKKSLNKTKVSDAKRLSIVNNNLFHPERKLKKKVVISKVAVTENFKLHGIRGRGENLIAEIEVLSRSKNLPTNRNTSKNDLVKPYKLKDKVGVNGFILSEINRQKFYIILKKEDKEQKLELE